MKIACVQMDITFGEPEGNYAAVEKYIEEAAKAHTDVIVLPEMWNTGYALDQLSNLADQNGKKTREFLAKLAKKYVMNIVGGSVATKKDGKFYNTMYVANRTGQIIADYDKAHLFKLMNEHQYMAEGQRMNLFDIEGISCSGTICYDLRFPEWIRTHILYGAKIMFIPAQWPKKRIDHWKLLLQARAIENQCFVVAVNRVGRDPNNVFNGHSMVIGPWGEQLNFEQTSEGIFYTEIDINEVDRVRRTIPIFEDRRKDLYN